MTSYFCESRSYDITEKIFGALQYTMHTVKLLYTLHNLFILPNKIVHDVITSLIDIGYAVLSNNLACNSKYYCNKAYPPVANDASMDAKQINATNDNQQLYLMSQSSSIILHFIYCSINLCFKSISFRSVGRVNISRHASIMPE